MLTPEILRNIAKFLGRADLKGAEVPAFTEVMTALQAELDRLTTSTKESENAHSSDIR